MALFSTDSILKESGLSLRDDLHIPRKLWHITTGCIGLTFYQLSGLSSKEMGYGLLAFGIAAFLFDTIRMRITALNQLTILIMKPFMRESEKTGYTGFSFYALGVAFTLLLFKEPIAILAICFLVFSDPISSFFGILYGSKKILPNKSLQGTLAGGICCFFISLIYCLALVGFKDYMMIFVFLAGTCGALAELVSFQLDDNLTLPIFSGLLLTGLNSLFLIL